MTFCIVPVAAHEGQVVELRLLQVHLCVRRRQRAVPERGDPVGVLVLRARLPALVVAAVQGSI